MMKNQLMILQEAAWHLIMECDLGENEMTMKQAKEKFLKLHPDQERVFDNSLLEYYGEGDIGYDFNHQPNYDTLEEKKMDFE